MFDRLIHTDEALFVFLNGLHCSFMDPIMVFMSRIAVWIPLYICIIFFLFWKRKRKVGWLALLGAVLTFALTDRLSVLLFKDVIQRLRPCYNPDLQTVIHLLEGCGGLFGFISSHAANTFGLAAFTAFFFRKKWYATAIFSWAALVSYSRVYVGKHYPLDIMCGALFGLLVGYAVYKLYKYIIQLKTAN